MANIKKIKLPNESTARNIVDAGAVRFDEAQSLTDVQKTQARSNIEVPNIFIQQEEPTSPAAKDIWVNTGDSAPASIVETKIYKESEWIDLTPSAFTGASSSAAGTSGLVPGPQTGDEGKFLKADGNWAEISSVDLGAIADVYDTTKTYAINDVVIYNNKLYRNKTAVSSAEAFNAAKWNEISVDNGMYLHDKVIPSTTYVHSTTAQGQTNAWQDYNIAFSLTNTNSTAYTSGKNLIQAVYDAGYTGTNHLAASGTVDTSTVASIAVSTSIAPGDYDIGIYDSDGNSLGTALSSGATITDTVSPGASTAIHPSAPSVDFSSMTASEMAQYVVDNPDQLATMKSVYGVAEFYEPADNTILRQSDVVNSLTSSSTTAPLSAAQGQALNTLINGSLHLTKYENARTWTASNNLPQNVTWQGITYGNGKFVTIGMRSGVVAYSVDGITWTQASVSAGYWSSVAFGNGRFVAVASSGTAVAISTDGVTWTSAAMPSSGSWENIIFAEGKFFAINTSGGIVAQSVDGTTGSWDVYSLPSASNWKGLAYGNGKLVATSYNANKSAYSINGGITWNPTTLPATRNWTALTYGNGRFVLVADGTNVAAYSDDGKTWTETTMPASDSWRCVAYGNEKFMAVAYNSNNAAYSIDGITWIALTVPRSTVWDGICYGRSRFVVVSDNVYAAYFIDRNDYLEQNDIDVTDDIGNIFGDDGRGLNVTRGGTIISGNADFAEIGEWHDGNSSGENRDGLFVTLTKGEYGFIIDKATSTSDVCGVVVEAPAFSGNAANKYDANGQLLQKYDYVALLGLVSVIDNGTCTAPGKCMPAADGTATPSSNNMGFNVISRIDATHIEVFVRPGADMLQRIKTDITGLDTRLSTVESTISGIAEFTAAEVDTLWDEN